MPASPADTDISARYTVRPCLTATPAAETDVVIVPPGGSLVSGFALAGTYTTLRGEERRVRLIGNGVTFERNWPPHIRSDSRLTLTELGAYRSGDVRTPT